ncbi:hypothetical protein GQ42DRAFT_81598 [Ramicandelaber brevisporus]|nr:hypothetical protein GQ42DRAFT_81598 [Ramicandelaber brevisporus]
MLSRSVSDDTSGGANGDIDNAVPATESDVCDPCSIPIISLTASVTHRELNDAAQMTLARCSLTSRQFSKSVKSK